MLCFTALGCAGTARIALVGADPAPEWFVLTGTLLFGCVFPWLGGRYWRQSRELAEAGRLRAARLEDEQRHAEERARLRERARIAQDMHDSLGHELSLIALRAGALQVAPGLAGAHRSAAADLRATAADATDRLHRIIGVLREDDEPVPLAPAGETLEQLVARAAQSGLPVRFEPAGREAGAEPGGAAERLLYRVVREALTNAARHAPGAPVVVSVVRRPAGTSVTVVNNPATGGGCAPSGGGTGLLGLRAAAAPATARHGRSSVTRDLSTSLHPYAPAVARGARTAIANARGLSRRARHHTAANSAAETSSPASVHSPAACRTHIGVSRAKSVMSR